jgi:AmmeMemoRadiSam system protein B
MENKKHREATHAPDWYTDDTEELDKTLKEWLNKATSLKDIFLKAIIVPHAGYEYSGSTAAWGYININPFNYNRVFLLGPSHYKYLGGCGLPVCNVYKTPLGDIEVDTELISKFSENKYFIKLTKIEEEQEHSLEMHLPYIKKVFGDNPFKLVPIMVGDLNNKGQELFGQIFSEYLKDPKSLFIISSDFCHWGRNFDYRIYDKKFGEIHQYIEKLDKEGIGFIEKQDPQGFHNYLEETDNTICGRNPISVFLNALVNSGMQTQTRLLFYKQSNQVKNTSQSSVSYASIATYIINNKI